MVNPEHWDVKAGDLKKRILIKEVRAFTRYRTIDMDMKKDLVKILEGKSSN